MALACGKSFKPNDSEASIIMALEDGEPTRVWVENRLFKSLEIRDDVDKVTSCE